ncbi:MAG: SGNH/GDSL hydrolase family protein [Clostridium sp.]|nr:SGNH/GDSL hydrolase family protein [Clostridium sp.]
MRFLFQGDSITDSGRGNHDDPHETGNGYVRLLEGDLTFKHQDYEVLNGGIGGDRIVDLLARWKKDCLNLKPDVLTILIGVNDVWHELGDGNGVRTELFEQVYRILIGEVQRVLPETKMVLMGAYVIPGPATTPDWEVFSGEVKARREVTAKLAEEFGLPFIDLQEAFYKGLEIAPAGHWCIDGVHPTAAGHRLIANAWKEALCPSGESQ